MHKKLGLTAGLTAIVLTTLLSACGGSTSSSTSKTLNLVQASDPSTVDVNDVRNANEFNILNATQEGLFRITSNKGHDHLKLAQAKSYTISKDGKTYTFKLRHSQWSDGKAVTAQQFVDSIIRELTPKNAFAYASMAYDIQGAEAFNTNKGSAKSVGAKALDQHTLQITLTHRTPYFLKKLSSVVFYPVRLDKIDKVGTKKWKTDWQDQVYNGAFKMKSWKTNGKIVLTKNSKFWNADKVKLNKVNVTTTDKDATITSLLQSGQLDAVLTSGANAADFTKLSKNSKIKKTTQSGGRTDFIVFNQHTGGTSKLLKNVKIRQALSLAINRSAYNKAINGGQGEPVYSFVPNSIDVNQTNYHEQIGDLLTPALKQYNTSAKLKQLFQAGLKELGQSTDLSKVTLNYLSTSGDDTGTFLKQQYHSKLGINVKVTTAPDDASFIASRNANKYDLLSNSWNGDYDDPSTFLNLWISTGGFQKFFGGYNSKTYDQRYATLATITNTAQRVKRYGELEKQLVTQDYGVAPVSGAKDQIFTNKQLKNFQTPVFGPDYDYVYASKN